MWSLLINLPDSVGPCSSHFIRQIKKLELALMCCTQHKKWVFVFKGKQTQSRHWLGLCFLDSYFYLIVEHSVHYRVSMLSGHNYGPETQTGRPSVATALSPNWCVCVCVVWSIHCVCDMFVCYVCMGLHEGLQALSDVSLSQWYRPVGFRTLQGSLVLLAAHQTQHSSVQILVLLLGGGRARHNLTDSCFIMKIPLTIL